MNVRPVAGKMPAIQQLKKVVFFNQAKETARRISDKQIKLNVSEDDIASFRWWELSKIPDRRLYSIWLA